MPRHLDAYIGRIWHDGELDDENGGWNSSTQVLAELFSRAGDYTFDKLTEIRLGAGDGLGLVYRHFDYPFDDVSNTILLQFHRNVMPNTRPG